MRPLQFVLLRLVACCYGIGFASVMAQSEAYTGSCGLYPSASHLAYQLVATAGFIGSLLLSLNLVVPVQLHLKLLAAMALSYALLCYIVFNEVAACDRLLVEAGMIAFLASDQRPLMRWFVARNIFAAAVAKLTQCDGSWFSFSSLPSDVLNQPFPFTPVWHLSQLSVAQVQLISLLVFVSEVSLPILISLSDSPGPLVGVLGLCLYYGVIGNFNWTMVIVAAFCVSLLPEEGVLFIMGPKTVARWGFGPRDGEPLAVDEGIAESILLNTFMEWGKVAGLLSVLAATVKYLLGTDVAFLLSSIAPLSAVAILMLLVTTISQWRSNKRHLALTLAGLGLSSPAFTSVLTFGALDHVEDFTSLPVCYTFGETFSTANPRHSKDGRAAFLFQTKFTQIGSNTVGSNLGGTQYAELSVAGSIHADEARPPFLVGHLPRLAMKLWRMGTGRDIDVTEGLALMVRLERVIESGSEAIRVMFPHTDESVLRALIGKGKSNQVQAFAQLYSVTRRAADHQWWKRDFEKAIALPTKQFHDLSQPLRIECSTIMPQKVFDVPIELVLTTLVVGLVVVRILLSKGDTYKRQGDVKSKKKE